MMKPIIMRCINQKTTMLNLPSVTLTCVIGKPKYFEQTIKAVVTSISKCNFRKIKVLSCIKFHNSKIECVQIPELYLNPRRCPDYIWHYIGRNATFGQSHRRHHQEPTHDHGAADHRPAVHPLAPCRFGRSARH